MLFQQNVATVSITVTWVDIKALAGVQSFDPDFSFHVQTDINISVSDNGNKARHFLQTLPAVC